MRVLALAAALLLTGCATLSSDAAAPTDRYLTDAAFDANADLPRPPGWRTAAAARDRKIFRTTRALKGAPRWTLAQADAHKDRILDVYACALGVTPTPAKNPQLVAMLAKMRRDVSSAVTEAKLEHLRPRPYLSQEGPICVDERLELAMSPDYPSGHATWGWAVGLLLAEAAPGRSEAILARARAYGESRVICGVHTASAVEAGRVNAENLIAALWSSEAFKNDLAGVRAELDASRLQGTPPDAAQCTAQANLLNAPIY